MSREHTLDCLSERWIEYLGGFVVDGYVNDYLSVSSELSDWYMNFPKGSYSPLSAEPKF